MAEEKIDKIDLAVKRLNVVADMPIFREKLRCIKGGTQGYGKKINSGRIKGTNYCVSYYEDKSSTPSKYVLASDLIPLEKVLNAEKNVACNKESEKQVTILDNKVKDLAIGGGKIPKEIDTGLDGIDGADDIDTWGGKKKKSVKKTKTIKRKKKVVTKKKTIKRKPQLF